jgi:hypothetical protein
MNIQLKLICFFGFIGTIFSGLKIGVASENGKNRTLVVWGPGSNGTVNRLKG